MRKFLFLVVILVFVFPLQAQIPFNWSVVNWSALNELMQQMSKTNFREARWGMTKAQIKAIEKGKSIGEKRSDDGLDFLAYEGKAGSLDCVIGYYFAENQLIEGRYFFTEKHANRILFIDDFRTVQNALTMKYGKPTEDETYWRNDLYKDDPSDWGMAVAVGHLAFETIWDIPETGVRLQLLGDNYKVSHRLGYYSKSRKHQDLKKKANEKAKKGIW